jgi:hypothetical protein
MADYRQIHTRIWKDGWFLNLEPDKKLLFIYLFSNERASVAGIYELPLQVISFETGLDAILIEKGIQTFSDAGKVFYEEDVVWVVNLRKYNDSGSVRVKVRIEKDFAAVPDGSVKRLYAEHYNLRYPIQQKREAMLPYPVNAGDHEHEKEQQNEQQHEPNRNGRMSKDESANLIDEVFDAWESSFPDKPRPRRTEEERRKVQNRLKSAHFRENYDAALVKASKCRSLHHVSWFLFEFFVKNDSNYQKMLDGWMDWKDKQDNEADQNHHKKEVTVDDAEKINSLLARGEI